MTEKSDQIIKEVNLTQYKCSHSRRTTLKLYLDEETSDVHFGFIVEQQLERVPAHKSILAKGSEVFQSMFYGKLREEGDVDIVDAPIDAFKAFLWFFYSDDVTVTEDNLASVMYLADKYDVAECIEICEEFINESLTIENVLSFYELAINFNRDELKSKLEQRINEEASILFTSDGFYQCSREILNNLLLIDLNFSAIGLFDACMQWAAKKCERNHLDPSIIGNCKKELAECFYLIPFALMSATQLSECVLKYRELFDRDELAELLAISASNKLIELKIFKAGLDVQWKCALINRELQFDTFSKQCDAYRFSVSEKCIFLGIKLYSMLKGANEEFLRGFLKVFDESDELTTTEILKQRIFIDCPKVKFDKAIVCTPNRKYRILIELESSSSSKNFYSMQDYSIALLLSFDFDEYNVQSDLDEVRAEQIEQLNESMML